MLQGQKKAPGVMRSRRERQPSAGGQVDAVDNADDREQASRRKPLFHRPEAIGIPPAGHHQQAVRRKTEGSKARTIGMAEFERIALPLAPEHHALACLLTLVFLLAQISLLAMQEGGRQRQAEIPNRGPAAIAVGHQFMQSGPAAAAQKERIDLCRVDKGGLDPADRSGAETVMFDEAYSPPQLSETGCSIR